MHLNGVFTQRESSQAAIQRTLLLIIPSSWWDSVLILLLVTIGRLGIVGDQHGVRKDTSESREPVLVSFVESINTPKMVVDVMVDLQKSPSVVCVVFFMITPILL